MAHEFDQPLAAEIMLHQIPIALGLAEPFPRHGEKMVLQQIGFGELHTPFVQRLEQQKGVVVVLHVDADDVDAVIEGVDDRVGDFLHALAAFADLGDLAMHEAEAFRDEPVRWRERFVIRQAKDFRDRPTVKDVVVVERLVGLVQHQAWREKLPLIVGFDEKILLDKGGQFALPPAFRWLRSAEISTAVVISRCCPSITTCSGAWLLLMTIEPRKYSGVAPVKVLETSDQKMPNWLSSQA